MNSCRSVPLLWVKWFASMCEFARTIFHINLTPHHQRHASMSDTPRCATIKVDFWDKSIDHIDLGNDRVDVVLEDAIKEFYGSDHAGNICRDTKAALEAVLTGEHKILIFSI